MNCHNCSISKERNHKKAFAVCLLHTPDFPTNTALQDGVNKLAVVAATDNNNVWSFITLTREEKHCIGFAMLEFTVDVGKWYWCELYN